MTSSPTMLREVSLDEMSARWEDALVAWDKSGAPFAPRFVEKGGRLRVREAGCRLTQLSYPCRCWIWADDQWRREVETTRLVIHWAASGHEHRWTLACCLRYEVTTTLFDLQLGGELWPSRHGLPPRLWISDSRNRARASAFARRTYERSGLKEACSLDRRFVETLREAVERASLQEQIDSLEYLDHSWVYPEPQPEYRFLGPVTL